MEIFRKKNEATYIAFPMVTTANPETFDTGETVTDTAYYKDGAGAWTSLAITDTVSEVGSTGVYTLDLTAAEMNHDRIFIKMTSTNAADTLITIVTFARDFDDLAFPTTAGNSIDVTATGEVGVDFANVAGTLTNANLAFVDANERVDVGEWLGTAVTSGTGGPDVNVNAISDDTTAAINLEAAYDGTGYNVGGGSIVAASVTGAVGSVTSAVTVGTINASVINAASIAASALNGKGDWNIGKTGYSISGTKTTLDALNDVSTAQVNTEVDNAIETYHLDHLLAVDYDPATKPGVATALLNELVENDVGVSRFTANALEQAPTGGDATAANQTTIINHLTDVKGAGWTSTDTLENIYNDTNELQATGVVLADSASHGGTASVLTLDRVVISTATSHGISVITTAANSDAVHLEANSTTGNVAGINAYGEWSGMVASNASGSTGNGFRITSNGSGAGLDTFSTSGEAIAQGTTSGTDRIKVDVDEIKTNATSATNLAQSTLGVIPGTAQTGTLSQTQMTTDLIGYENDELIGRVVVFQSGTADGQATEITDYASASGLITFTTITTAPANNDTFVIV